MKVADQEYLRSEQYKTSDNLQARIDLHRRFGTNPYDWMFWVFDQFDIQAGMRILEVGCGPGGLWIQNRNRLPDGLELVLADLSPGMVTRARLEIDGQTSSKDSSRFHFLVSDAQRLPFPENYFDVVIANHMLYHVPDISAALLEFRRLLKSSGRLFAATNGQNHMIDLYNLLEDFDPQVLVLKNSTRRFSLENGPEIFRSFFDQVELRLYESDLDVTDVEPLLAYLYSSWSFAGALTNEQQKIIEEHIRARFSEQGHLYIRKAQGVLIAQG